MKRLLLICFIFNSILASAQLSISPVDITALGIATDEKIETDFTIDNSGTEVASFYWRIANAKDRPAEWGLSVCDLFTCYPEESSIFSSPANKINMIEAEGEGLFNFYVYPHGQAAEYEFVIELYDVNDEENIYTSINIFVSTLTSSTNDENEYSASLSIFPNPTSDMFQIKNDDRVATVAMYNIVGKQINAMDHKEGNFYNISDYRKGMYLVRLFDDKGNALKALRLNKE
jgi:hypothetical protein